ncbi:MAG: hypothetical protein IT456_11415 [Planctomycetes bacterium]|nr:hypothetical protein [Planctomycetota bacterium]
MTNQLQGEILFKGWAGGADAAAWAYTPWMPVRGDVGTFGVEVTYLGGVTLTWNVQTRSLEDPSTITTILAADQTTAAVGPVSATSTVAAKQLVRYRFSTGATASTTDFALLRALQPSWQGDR